MWVLCKSALVSIFIINVSRKERNGMDKSEALRQMTEVRNEILAGNRERAERQKAMGRLTARERMNSLFDAGSFVELDAFRKGGVITGFGTVNGRPCYAFAQDVTDGGAAMNTLQADKILRMLSQARMTLSPVVIFPDSNGICLEEGAAAMNAYADVMKAMTLLSGICPMICCVSGNCPGTAAVFTQLADITVQSACGRVTFCGLKVMQKGEDKDKDDKALFGNDTMSSQAVCALTAGSEQDAVAAVKEVLDFLPNSNQEEAQVGDGEDLNRLIKNADSMTAMELVTALADYGRVTELNGNFGTQTRTCLARIGGRAAGIVAQTGGNMGTDDMNKMARFVRLCDSFSMPVITLVDTEGVAVPDSAGQGEMMRAASKLLYAYAEADCVKISVVTGAAIGKAYTLLGGGSMADVRYAWPGATLAAVSEDVYTRTLGKPDYDNKFSAVAAAKKGLVDDCIDPADTRKMLINALEFLIVKKVPSPERKHGNMPL